MGQSLIRYFAVICVVAGALLMGGPGAVAFADEPGDGSGGDPAGETGASRTAEPPAAPRGFRLPNWMRLPSFGSATDNAPRIGFIPPPVMNLPSTLRPGITPNGSLTTRQQTPPSGSTTPFDIESITKPAGRDATVEATVPDITSPSQSSTDVNLGNSGTTTTTGTTTGQLGPAARQATDSATVPEQTPPSSTRKPPTVDLTALVPDAVPTGTPVTIKNPLRQLLAPELDPTKPATEQLLPPPVVALLAAVAEQVPLAGLLITPVMDLADFVIPMLLSDVVVPSLSLSSMLPTPAPRTQVLAGTPVTMPLARTESPPVELSLTGMDVAAGPPALPAPLSAGIEKPQAPPEPPATEPDVASVDNSVEFRAGYSDYLRNAGMAQITAIAVPGAAAILLFSLGGGFIGYRQARAGHVIRAEGITRFLR